MTKVITAAILSLFLQNDGEVSEGKPLDGVLCKSGDGCYRFEEAVKNIVHRRNLKLYSGDHISLVHQRNGRYAIHMKKIEATDVTNRYELAKAISDEIIDALNIINN